MKIEIISDNQVKFILNQMDLEERNIRITELAYGSEKTQALFREMMEQAMAEYGFDGDNVPLMIEAIPFSGDSITIIVTKVTNVSDIEKRFNLLSNASKNKGLTKGETVANDKGASAKYSNTLLYSFANIDQVAEVAFRINGVYTGANALYKNQSRYFLLFKCDSANSHDERIDLDALLGEYGQKHSATYLSKSYLQEHGELIIRNKAVEILAEYLS